MALKLMTFNEKRDIYLTEIKNQLLGFRFSGYYRKFSYREIMSALYENSTIVSKDLTTNIHLFYGSSDDANNIEYKLAEILTLCLFLKLHKECDPYEAFNNQKKLELLLKNIEARLKEVLPEYKINFEEKPLTYEPVETKTVIDNLGDIPEVIANPISELLKPMKSEVETIGLIGKVYTSLEKISSKDIEHLNETDKTILRRSQELVKILANKVDGAKGHSGDSSLSVIDIAHNLALNASLVQKLLNKKAE